MGKTNRYDSDNNTKKSYRKKRKSKDNKKQNINNKSFS